MTIDLTLKESPTAISTYETALKSLQGRISGWSHDVTGQRSKALANWEGGAADAFGAATSRTTGHMDALAKIVKTHASDVRTFHDSVVAVKGHLAGIKAEARSAGLVVNGEVISLPPAPPPVMLPAGQPVPASVQKTFDDYDKLVTTYNGLVTKVKEQFHTLYEAHLTFQRACGKVKAPDGLSVGTPPTTGARATVDQMASTQSDLETAKDLGVAGAGSYLGTFAPRGPAGKILRNAKAADVSEWVATAGNERAMSAVKAVARRGELLEHAGYALAAAGAAVDGYQQWQQDSHDPTLSTSAKVVRATATGVADNLPSFSGGFAGAELGAMGGAELGGAIGGPVGALVGGAVGGVVGGVVGAETMQAGYDKAKDWMHHLIDKIRW